LLGNSDGILVPGGFGQRGIEGKISAIRYARENNVPFLGICLGMQMAVVEYARNVCGLKGANSTEFDKKTKYPVVCILKEQKSLKNKGATMRLGRYLCRLTGAGISKRLYKKLIISERHRHRYELNNRYKKILKKHGLLIAGICVKHTLTEIIEIKNHPWYIACQFHPEFKSKPDRPHPLFRGFIEASLFRRTNSGMHRRSCQK
jgi:CTP synthase